MNATINAALAAQYAAALDMLENAVNACPEALWGDRSRRPEFWYTVYHTLFWLDYYLNRDREGFAPPAPFTMDELDPAGVLPDRVYAKAELLAYLAHGRAKCARTIAAMSGADAWARHGSARPEIPAGELLLDNLRHVQHHVGQLQMILGQVNGEAPRYVTTSTLDRRLGE